MAESGDEKGESKSVEGTDLEETTPLPRRKVQGVLRKRWAFTLNNYTSRDVDLLKTKEVMSVPVMIFQSEIAATGTKHLQGYLEFAKQRRPLQFYKRILGHSRMHWTACDGDREKNVTYCTKEDTYDGKIRYERGLPRRLVKLTREVMRANQLAIADEYKEFEDPLFGREIHWYWEEKGGWGKSILCKYMVHQMGALLLGGANKDALYGVASWVTKFGEGPPIIIFDIPRVNAGAVSYQSLEYIKNGVFYNSKYESGMVLFNSPHILVFANCPPDYTKLSPDRWCVKELQAEIIELQEDHLDDDEIDQAGVEEDFFDV